MRQRAGLRADRVSSPNDITYHMVDGWHLSADFIWGFFYGEPGLSESQRKGLMARIPYSEMIKHRNCIFIK